MLHSDRPPAPRVGSSASRCHSMTRAEPNGLISKHQIDEEAESRLTLPRVKMTPRRVCWRPGRLLATLAVVGLTACAGEDSGIVGEPCTTGHGCGTASGAACILRWPEGYCTEFDCTLGSCPEAARCVTGITFANVPVDAFCLVVCRSAQDCRAGYSCMEVGGPERVCTPDS